MTKRLQQQPVAHEQDNATIPSFHTKTEFQRTCNLTGNKNGSPEPLNSIPHMQKMSSASDTVVFETLKQEPKVSGTQWTQGGSDCTKEQLTNNQHKKKKSKKHKDKERERLKDNQGSEWLETSPDLKQNVDKLDSKTLFILYMRQTMFLTISYNVLINKTFSFPTMH